MFFCVSYANEEGIPKPKNWYSIAAKIGKPACGECCWQQVHGIAINLACPKLLHKSHFYGHKSLEFRVISPLDRNNGKSAHLNSGPQCEWSNFIICILTLENMPPRIMIRQSLAFIEVSVCGTNYNWADRDIGQNIKNSNNNSRRAEAVGKAESWFHSSLKTQKRHLQKINEKALDSTWITCQLQAHITQTLVAFITSFLTYFLVKTKRTLNNSMPAWRP